MATSQDHKRAGDGDTGLNTGGMGAYSPAPVVSEAIHQRIMDEVILPTIKGMAAEGLPYTGFLYAGLMIMADGTPKVIEYNCRFGDPETQPIMLRMRSDLVAHCLAAINGQLDSETTEWDPRAALVRGARRRTATPATTPRAVVISGLPESECDGEKVFHAGTAEQDGQVVTAVRPGALRHRPGRGRRHGAKHWAYQLARSISLGRGLSAQRHRAIVRWPVSRAETGQPGRRPITPLTLGFRGNSYAGAAWRSPIWPPPASTTRWSPSVWDKLEPQQCRFSAWRC